MKVRILYHDHCFDGAASAAFFSRFLKKTRYPEAEYLYTGMAHTADQLFAESMFDGEINAIVDFKYSPNPKLSWWFDHHQSAFLTPEDAAHYHAGKNPLHFFDPGYRSCTKFIRDIARDQFGFTAPDLDDLVKWADIIDGAQYADAQEAVELSAPATKLVLVIEAVKGSEMVQRIIRAMQSMTLEEIIALPEVASAFAPLYERQLLAHEVEENHHIDCRGILADDIE